MTEAAAHKARQAWPPYQAIHGTVLAGGEGQQQHSATAATGQQLLALGAGGQPLRDSLALLAQLAAAAAAGAGAALYCSRRAKGQLLEGVLPRQLHQHRSPERR